MILLNCKPLISVLYVPSLVWVNLLDLMCLCCVCTCVMCVPTDRATGEIPLNYTQVVINYRWHFGHVNDFILKWGPRAAATEVHHECVCVFKLERYHLWPCSRLSRKHAHMHMRAHTLAWVCWWVRALSSTSQCFDEHTHYAKECSMPGLPCAFRKG